MLAYKLIFSSSHNICWAISASLEENIIYDDSNNDCYLRSAEQHNCQFGKSTLRQKVWKFTVDKLTNCPGTGHRSWCADIIKPGNITNITPISSAPIIGGNNTILSRILTQHSNIRTFTIHSYSSHCKHQHTFRYFSESHHNYTSH